MKVHYIIPLNSQLIGHPENFKIKQYYFQERLSLRYNIILKLLSPFHTYEITNFQKDQSFKEHSKSRRFSILFSISLIIVFMISYSQI